MKPSDTLHKIEAFWEVNLCPCKKSPIEVRNVGRIDLTELLAYLEFNEGVEVGTEEGVYAEALCKANPNLHLTCVDPWEAYKGYREHVTQPVLDALHELAQDRLSPFNCTLIPKYSIEAMQGIPNESLDFVYIDGNHDLGHTISDIVGWSPKVKSGGIVSGHDYVRRSKHDPALCHVIEAVHAYVSAYHINPWMLLGTKDILQGEVRDKARSWMWVKP